MIRSSGPLFWSTLLAQAHSNMLQSLPAGPYPETLETLFLNDNPPLQKLPASLGDERNEGVHPLAPLCPPPLPPPCPPLAPGGIAWRRAQRG